jgi:geranylgeranyl diphosphate synthase type II
MALDPEGYRQRVEAALEEVLDAREKGDPLYHPIQHMLEMGGKRFRPVALLMASELYGESMEDALPASVGIELFHNFTLMHDDLMDEAPLRRGKETVHQRYGANMAVLSGDAMFVKAYGEMRKVPASILQEVLGDFDRVALEVCEGQRMDMDFEDRRDVSVAEYLRMIASKTGALLGGAFSIGSRIGGASEEEARGMERLGRNTGVAFQLQDDFLDVFGDEGKFGKQQGGDIIAEKKTYLLIRAREKADSEQLERLDDALREKDEREKVRRVVELYRELGVEEESKELSRRYFDEALKTLERAGVDEERKDSVRGLLELLHEREA